MAEFAQNKNYIATERLVSSLHALIGAGKSDSSDAEAIRDKLDGYWWGLSAPERLRLERLSAELPMLYGDEQAEPRPRVSANEAKLNRERRKQKGIRSDAEWEQKEKCRLADEIGRARASGRWHTVLALLRRNPSVLSPADTAECRARAYMVLGHLETAEVFQRFAVALDSDGPWRKIILSDILASGEHGEEAANLASGVLSSVSNDSDLSLYACLQLIRAVPQTKDPDNTIANRIVSVLSHLLSNPQSFVGNPGSRVSAHNILAQAYVRLSDKENAKRSYDAALTLNAHDPVALSGLGHIYYREYPERAAQLFRASLEVDPVAPGAAFFLAHFHLMRKEPAKAREYADMALESILTDRMKAAVLMWRATANLGLRDPSKVRRDLELALSVTPGDQRILKLLSFVPELERDEFRFQHRAFDEPVDSSVFEAGMNSAAIEISPHRTRDFIYAR